jgi:hypothetical protein
MQQAQKKVAEPSAPIRIDDPAAQMFKDRVVRITGYNHMSRKEGSTTMLVTYMPSLSTAARFDSAMHIEGYDIEQFMWRTVMYRRDATISEPIVMMADKRAVELFPAVRELGKARYHSTIGADPEVFVERGDGSLFPAFEFLGPKHDYQTDSPPACYWDGYQAEFAFYPPECMDTLVTRIGEGLRFIQQAALARDKNAKLSVRTTFDIPAERLLSDKPEHVEFGCNPSLNVYGEKMPKPQGIDVPFRSSGGHLHFSIPRGSKNKLLPRMIKELDRILGVISVAMFQYYDRPERRMLYGRAGEYRAPKYGFEYRVLSSAWTIHPGLVQFVYEAARHIIGAVMQQKTDAPLSWWDVSEDEARACINNCDVGMAQALMQRNNTGLLTLLLAMPHFTSMEEPALDVMDRLIAGPLMNGVHTALRNPNQYSLSWEHLYPEARAPYVRQWSLALNWFVNKGMFD